MRKRLKEALKNKKVAAIQEVVDAAREHEAAHKLADLIYQCEERIEDLEQERRECEVLELLEKEQADMKAATLTKKQVSCDCNRLH